MGKAQSKYKKFIESCQCDDDSFSLTKGSDSSPYALCFAIFGYKLILADSVINKNCKIWDKNLRLGLKLKRAERIQIVNLNFDKEYLFHQDH